MKIFLAVIGGLALLLLVAAVWAQEGPPEEPPTEDAETGVVADAEEGAQAPGQARTRRGVRRLGDVVGGTGEEWSMDIGELDLPAGPVAEQPRVSLPDAEQDERLQRLLTRRAFSPEDPEIEAELSGLIDEVASQARDALETGDLPLASRLVEVIAGLGEDRPIIGEVRAEEDRLGRIDRLLVEADRALAEGRLIEPAGDSALERFREVAEIEPGHEAVTAGLAQIQQGLLERAVEAARGLDFEDAERLLVVAGELDPDEPAVAETRADIVAFREHEIDDVVAAVRQSIDDRDYERAEDGITQLVALGAERARINSLRESLNDARVYGGFEPGEVFWDELEADGQPGPEMVVIPAGNFMMGSPENERGRARHEGPRIRVTFERGFALSRTEITVGHFRRFVEATGYRSDAERQGSSRTYNAETGRLDPRRGINWRHDYLGNRAEDELPVIHVSWNDAAAYAAWLAEQTDQPYRLPSEAEFEYALRAGTQTPYWWGEGSPDRSEVENVTGDADRSTTRRSWTVAFRRYDSGFWGPAPAGSLEPNPFGLYDMGGNVMEWVEDCWHDSYVRAPTDGTAWVNPGCDRRVLRGGAWSSTPEMSRSAFRIASVEDATDARVGFRVARDL